MYDRKIGIGVLIKRKKNREKIGKLQRCARKKVFC